MKIAKLCLAVALLILLGSSSASATIHNVDAGPGLQFFPTELYIVSGDTVRWTVVEGIHTSSSAPGLSKTWDSGNMGVGETFDVVFTVADGDGPFQYRCDLHWASGMVGVVYIDNDNDGVAAHLDCDDTDPDAGQCFSCCIGRRGNANGDPLDILNLSDVVYLVKYFFDIPPGPPPACIEEANMNGDPEEKLNVSDLTYVIEYMFGIPNGPQPPMCP